MWEKGKVQGSMSRPASFWTSGERRGYQKEAVEMYFKTFRRVVLSFDCHLFVFVQDILPPSLTRPGVPLQLAQSTNTNSGSPWLQELN